MNIWISTIVVFLLILALIRCIKYLLNYRLSQQLIRVKPVLITGASSGLGRALAINLFLKDAVLYLCARNTQELQNTAEMCRREYIKVVWEKTKKSKS